MLKKGRDERGILELLEHHMMYVIRQVTWREALTNLIFQNRSSRLSYTVVFPSGEPITGSYSIDSQNAQICIRVGTKSIKNGCQSERPLVSLDEREFSGEGQQAIDHRGCC